MNGWSAGDRDAGRLGRQLLCLFPRDFGLPEQEEVDVVRRQRVVDRRLDLVARPRRTHEVRRDDDDEIGLVLLIRLAGEQRAEHRHVAKPGQLLDRVLAVALQQAADHEALAVAQLDRRRSAAHDQRRHRDAVADRHRMGRVDLADLRLDLHVDQARPSTVGVKARPTPYFL